MPKKDQTGSAPAHEQATSELGGRRMLACEKCDAMFSYPDLVEGDSAYCYHCGFSIFSRRPNAVQRSAAWAMAAAALFVVANFFPFITLDVAGQRNGIVLAESVGALADRENKGLATAVATFIFVAPTILITGILYLMLPLLGGRRLPGARYVARWIYGFSVWDMTEIFLLGVLVSLIKMLDYATIDLGISFYAFSVMIVCITAARSCIGKHELWEHLDGAAAA